MTKTKLRNISTKISLWKMHICRFLWYSRKKSKLHFLPKAFAAHRDKIKGALYVPGFYKKGVLALQKVDFSNTCILKKRYIGSGQGHSVLIAKKGIGWLIPENGKTVIEFDCNTLKELNRIERMNRIFGGHGALSQDERYLYLVDRGTEDNHIESSLLIYEVSQRKIVDSITNIGIYAHDIALLEDTRYTVVANYGRITDFVGVGEKSKLSKKMRAKRLPSYALIDLADKRVCRIHMMEGEYMLAHVVKGAERNVAYIQGTDYRKTESLKAGEIEEIIKRRNAPLSTEEKIRRTIFQPGMQFKVDAMTGTLLAQTKHTLSRSQSLCLLKEKKLIVESFAINGCLAYFDSDSLENKKTYHFSGKRSIDPRGIALTDDEKYLFVSERAKNIYCFDLENTNEDPVGNIRTFNAINSHICYSR